MSSCKILYICQEITPYLPESDMSVLCRTLSQAMQERGNEIRTFMPRYGNVNERRNQLHEVIRLSGMNLIINNNDHQLIIKVASIPSARVQIYFIDNDDYFSRKSTVEDADGGIFADNDERSIFFARGVLETVRKLRWSPDIVHIHGWFSAVVPLYVKDIFADDPIFKDVKVVVSLYDNGFGGSYDPAFKEKLASEGCGRQHFHMIENPTYQNLMKFVINYTDGVILENEGVCSELRDYVREAGKPCLDCIDKSSADYLDRYQNFYEQILAHD